MARLEMRDLTNTSAADTSHAETFRETIAPPDSTQARHIRRWLVPATEIVWVVLFSVFLGREFLNFDPAFRVHGSETEWTVVSVEWISTVLHADGYVPRWYPFVNRGQPTIDQGHSTLLNPIESVPSLVLGSTNGLKISVILLFMVGGAGGVILGRTLGWCLPARLLLAGLLMARGTTYALFGWGYPQLAGQQMYFPWVLAGVLGLARGLNPRRYVPVLAVALSQTYLTGNIYFILPAGALSAVLLLMFAIRMRPRLHVEWSFVRYMALALVLAVGLMAVSALGVLVLYSYVGGHPNYRPVQTMSLSYPLVQYFVPTRMFDGMDMENRYVFVAPWWFMVAIFVLLPPIPRLLHRSDDAATTTRLWLFLVGGFFFFVTFGAGVNPITNWLWENIYVLGQWRFLERMLSVGGFLLAVAIALRVDGLWKATIDYQANILSFGGRLVGAFMTLLRPALATSAVLVPLWVALNLDWPWTLVARDLDLVTCMAELRARHPGEFLMTDNLGYTNMWAYHESDIRLAYLGADYDQQGREPDLFMNDLTKLPAPYYISEGDGPWLLEQGYTPVEGIYRPRDTQSPCVWFNPNHIPYAFSAPVRAFETNDEDEVKAAFSPVEVLAFESEVTRLRAENPTDEPLAVVAQTISYPGWEATLNGEPVDLLSVGYLMGVILPPKTASSIIAFTYHPTLLTIGGLITIATTVVLIAYMLRVDERISPYWRKRQEPESENAELAAAWTITPYIAPITSTVETASSTTDTPPPAIQWAFYRAILVAFGAALAGVFAFALGWLIGGRRR